MVGILIISHGRLAEALISSVQSLVGDLQRVRGVSLWPKDSEEEIKIRIRARSSFSELSERRMIMVAYEFYRLDEANRSHLIGVLPERRENQERITEESLMEWVKKLLGDSENFNHVFFVKVTLDWV